MKNGCANTDKAGECVPTFNVIDEKDGRMSFSVHTDDDNEISGLFVCERKLSIECVFEMWNVIPTVLSLTLSI